MRQTTSKLLFEYWNAKRGGRLAPRRFEIEPARIAPLLPETFIVECAGLLSFRFRLAGTRICEQFGRELRGEDFLALWRESDREGMAGLVFSAVRDGAVGVVLFEASADHRHSVKFEMLTMPLVHTGNTVNRLMGCISALETPYWLGVKPLRHFSILSMQRYDADPARDFGPVPATAPGHASVPRFTVLQGGLTDTDA